MFSKGEEKKSVAEMVNSSNVIARETFIKGDITTSGNIRIEGKVEGTLSSQNKIVIGDSASLEGNIEAREAEIAGNIKGVVRCSEILYLKESAVIDGDIYTKKLVIENGAVLNGLCKMSQTEDSIGSGNEEQLNTEMNDGTREKTPKGKEIVSE